MCTPYHSIHWPLQKNSADKQQLLIENNQQTYAVTTYKGRKLVTSFIYSLSSVMCGEIIEKVTAIAKQNIRQPTVNTQLLGMFKVNPMTATDEVCQRTKIEILSNSGLKARQWRQLELKFGINQIEGKACFEKVEELLKSYMEDRRGTGNIIIIGSENIQNRFLFTLNQRAEDIRAWGENTMLDFLNYLYPKLGFQMVGPATITDAQKKLFDVELTAVFPNPNKLSCLAYALLLAGEKNAKNRIFRDEESDSLLKDPLKSLTEWGWRVVDSPCEGDLVIYYNSEKKIGMHAGLYGLDGNVISKLGIINPFVYSHPLFSVCGIYGTEVIFMRKSNAILFTEETTRRSQKLET